MTRPYGELFSDALISEIKAEMGRRDLSSRALGRLIGKSSQYMSDRFDGGSSKTGRRVVLSVWDLAAISEALGLRASDLTLRAHQAALEVDTDGAAITPIRRNVGGAPQTDLETVELDTTQLAASTDNTPVDPTRGEA
ncbi:hypothetical protein [Microbacterium sp. IEGM 1404]|uniref:hypothetical protein n=1 Tax=Microbacterium sp. IEGM 1404 TaxID=3047084 RepID=UPI0024B73DB6|nr:hypothetical protein [Microbacterium sp. IEGM 1404]MDI9889927.1 hypothetical protein [Microbacterium sp. IEGM 1404]